MQSLLLSTFSESVELDTWNAPLKTLRNPFRRKSDVSVQWPKTFIQVFLLPDKNLKLFICTRRLRFWEIWLNIMLKVQVFLLKTQNCFWKKKTKFSKVNFPNFVLSARWSVVWHTWLKKSAKRQRNHSNSKNDNRKIKLFRKRNHFSPEHFSGSANFCCIDPEENFLTKSPIFSSQTPKKFAIMFIFKKNVFPQIFLKVRRLKFWQQSR